MIVHLLGTLGQGAFFLTCLDSERIVFPLRQASLPTSVFLMSLCNYWVAFLTLTLRSRVKDSFLSRDCIKGHTFLGIPSETLSVGCGWRWAFQCHTVVGCAHFYMTQVPGHASVNLRCVAPQASMDVGALSRHSCFALLWLSGKELWILSSYHGFKVLIFYLFIFWFTIHKYLSLVS